jgi:urea transport system permease protein
MNLTVPQGHWLHFSDFAVSLVGKIMCYAICALAMDLIWGYTGILSLGHGLFFAIGGYVMGMYLMRQIGTDGNYKSNLPDFMVFLDWKELPWHWTLSDSFVATLLLIVLVPAVVSGVFGYFAFRSRIKGVYFSIITQAMTFAAMLLFFRNETGFGGNNGFTDFKRSSVASLAACCKPFEMLSLASCFLATRLCLTSSAFGSSLPSCVVWRVLCMCRKWASSTLVK